MSDINATVPTQEQTPAEEQGRTFTQEEVNAIVGKRLAETRAKYADYETLKEKAAKFDKTEEAAKSDLQKATERAEALQKQLDSMIQADKLRQIRDKVSKETGVPITLLSGETEEACTEQAKAILAFAQPTQTGYPQIRDAGEITNIGGGKTRDQFKSWFEANIQKK